MAKLVEEREIVSRPMIESVYPSRFILNTAAVPDNDGGRDLEYSAEVVFTSVLRDKATGIVQSSQVKGSLLLDNAQLDQLGLLTPLKRFLRDVQEVRLTDAKPMVRPSVL